MSDERKIKDEELLEGYRDPVKFAEVFLGLQPISETQIRILRSPAKRICIAAGRRWGKTTTLAIYVLWFALTRKLDYAKVGIFTPSWEQCVIFIDTLKELIERMPESFRKKMNITENRRTEIVIDGCKIFARSATRTSRSIRGHGVDLQIEDEAAFIPDDMMAAIRPVRITSKAKEIMASTTLGRNHFWKAFNSKVFESFHVPTWDNNLIDKKELEDEKELLTQTEFNQEYGAEFIDDRYSVIPQTLIDNAVMFDKSFILEPVAGVDYVMGVDLGRRRDISVCFIAHAEMNHLFVDYIEELGIPSSETFWSGVLFRIEELAKKFKIRKMCVDQTGIGDKPTEDLKISLTKNNVSCFVEGVDFTRRLKNSKEGLISSLSLKFERREIHFPFCEKLIRQLKNLRFEASEVPSYSERIYGKYSHVGHDDYVAALLLSMYAIPETIQLLYTRSSEMSYKPSILGGLVVTNKEFPRL